MMMTYFSIILTLTAISLALYVGYTLKKKADKTYEKFIFSGLLGFMLVLVALGICLWAKMDLFTKNSAAVTIMSLVLSLSIISASIGFAKLKWSKSKQELRQAMLEEFRRDLGLNIPSSETTPAAPVAPVVSPAVNSAPVKPATSSADPNVRSVSVRPARIPLPSQFLQLSNGQVEIDGVVYEPVPVTLNKPSSPPPADKVQ